VIHAKELLAFLDGESRVLPVMASTNRPRFLLAEAA